MSPQFTSKLYDQSLFLILLCVCLTYFGCHASSETNSKNNTGIQCVKSERDALLEFKRGIRVDRCGLLDSWVANQDCCLWQGIQCHNDSGRIISVRIPTPQVSDYDDYTPCLEGTLGISSLADLKYLKYLDLSCNRFQGQFPKFIGSLTNLEHLNLSHVGFTGIIPHEIGNLSRLSSLDFNCVYDNSMRVESVRWLSQLTLLREVDLGGIDLSVATNSWVSVVNNLRFLQVLRLDNCDLSLKLPSSLSYINSSTTLNTISLSGNNLNNTSIFVWLSNLSELETNLVYLDLSDNQQLFENNFQGTEYAMNFLGKICSLQTLRLSNTILYYDFSDIIQSLSVCSHKSIVYLGLSNNKIWGSIPDNISNLSYLKRLYVGYNQLNGTVSQALGGLPLLEKLSIPLNSLKGVFTSAHLSNLTKLTRLYLSNNVELVVNISANWIPPFQLDELDLSSCKVGPDFPMWVITQKKLTVIDISNASISSTIPDSFFNSLSSELFFLSMSGNMMYGVLPDSSITFESHPVIDLSSNNFSGAIPSFLRNNVSMLYLDNNNLSQGLVPFMCPQTKIPLTELRMSNNSFSDRLPDCWGNFDNLLVLDLGNNKFWGNLPVSIGALNKLVFLHLSNNNFSGELPASLVNCTSLVFVDLAHNSLTGNIPSAFGNTIKNLSIVILQDNNFSGVLPTSLCHLSRLQILEFSNNRISGTIPRCIYNLTEMATTWTDLSYTVSSDYAPFSFSLALENAFIVWKREERNFKGQYTLEEAKFLDISNNMLEGHIPEEISSLIGLKQINLSRNHLSGTITTRIGQLTSLESLDLSYNQLSGPIPTSLAKISSLGVLDLSYNNLSGKIPDGTQLQSFNASSYMGNPGLCGEPLPECDRDEAAIIPKNNVDNEQNTDNFMLGLYISVVLGFIIGFWGVCGTLIIKASWRHAFFRFYDDLKDRIYVMVVVNIHRVWGRA